MYFYTMIYLITAIICGSLFSILFKVCARSGGDSRLVIFYNYITALTASLFPIGKGIFIDGTPASSFVLPGWTIGLTLISGLFFMLGFVCLNSSTQKCGVALTTVCAKAALVIPVILCYLFLGEKEPAWGPVAMMFAAMILIISPSPSAFKGHSGKDFAAGALLVFLCYGVSDFMLKLNQHSVRLNAGADQVLENAGMDSMMSFIFLFAMIASFAYCLMKGSFKNKENRLKNILFGLTLGLVNLGCTSSMIRSLASLPSNVFFPIYNTGVVLVGTAAGILFFREKMKWTQVLGLLLAVIAVILLKR